jgi:hypothetical protein
LASKNEFLQVHSDEEFLDSEIQEKQFEELKQLRQLKMHGSQ